MKNDKYVKYELLDCLDEVSSVQKMIDLYDEDSDKISNFMLLQYKVIKRRAINEFNKITNGKKISEY